MTTYRLIIKADNLKPLVDLITSKPDGEVHILIAGEFDLQAIMAELTATLARDLSKYCYMKMSVGQMIIKATQDDSISDDMLNVVIATED